MPLNIALPSPLIVKPPITLFSIISTEMALMAINSAFLFCVSNITLFKELVSPITFSEILIHNLASIPAFNKLELEFI